MVQYWLCVNPIVGEPSSRFVGSLTTNYHHLKYPEMCAGVVDKVSNNKSQRKKNFLPYRMLL